MKHFLFGGISLLIFLSSCKKSAGDNPDETVKFPFFAEWNPGGLQASAEFSGSKAVGPVTYLNEASGICVSLKNKGYLWAHNDGGSRPYLYLIDKKTAQLKATFNIKNLPSGDFEDIAIGGGPVAGKSYIYFADIGDNSQNRAQVVVYRVEEPELSGIERGVTELSTPFDKFIFTYPDGARDAETIMLNPDTKDLYIVSKRQLHNILYVGRYPYNTGSATELIQTGTFPFTLSTAGDIAADGSSILIKTYNQVFYWKKEKDEPLLNLLSREPKTVPYTSEPQGEAICMDTDGYYTLSEKTEGNVPVLYFYARR